MDLTHVILGEVATEKAQRQQDKKIALLRVHPHATKVDVRNALHRFFGVEALSIRMLHVRSKHRLFGKNQTMRKRAASKRAYVTLSPESKALDLTAFKT